MRCTRVFATFSGNASYILYQKIRFFSNCGFFSFYRPVFRHVVLYNKKRQTLDLPKNNLIFIFSFVVILSQVFCYSCPICTSSFIMSAHSLIVFLTESTLLAIVFVALSIVSLFSFRYIFFSTYLLYRKSCCLLFARGDKFVFFV